MNDSSKHDHDQKHDNDQESDHGQGDDRLDSDSNSDSMDLEGAEWVAIGYVSDRVTADFVIDSLRSYKIPAVLNSKTGFFGTIGLTSVESPFSGSAGANEILTIAEKVEEACDIASMVAGDKWEPADLEE